MTRSVADKTIADFARRQHDWMERVLKGSLDPEEVSAVVQILIDRGKEKQHTFLRPEGSVQVDLIAGTFNPREFFQARQGLWVSAGFSDRILSVASEAKPAISVSQYVQMSKFRLVKPAHDSEIRQELPSEHLTELWQIAELIRRQPEGKKGDLLNNGNANIFYVRGKGGAVFAVDVGWSAGNQDWDVRAWRLDEGGGGKWRDDCQIFSRNC